MRKGLALALPLLAFPSAASAATIIVYTDPMTFERSTVVLDTPGPDRAFMCMKPPSDSGCVRLAVRRGR